MFKKTKIMELEIGMRDLKRLVHSYTETTRKMIESAYVGKTVRTIIDSETIDFVVEKVDVGNGCIYLEGGGWTDVTGWKYTAKLENCVIKKYP